MPRTSRILDSRRTRCRVLMIAPRDHKLFRGKKESLFRRAPKPTRGTHKKKTFANAQMSRCSRAYARHQFTRLAETPLQIFVPTKGAAKAVTERCTLPWHTIKTSTSAKESRWEFFCQPGNFGYPITAESWAAIFVR